MTLETVGFPFFSARVKKIVPTADPAKPEKIRKPQVRASIVGISRTCNRRRGRNMSRISTCSQKTITSALKRSFNGMRHALSVPQSAAPSATSHGPYLTLLADRFVMPEGCIVRAAARQRRRDALNLERGNERTDRKIGKVADPS